MDCDYERCDTGLFRREVVPVPLDEGRRIAAWIYLFNGSTAGMRRIESGDFLAPAP